MVSWFEEIYPNLIKPFVGMAEEDEDSEEDVGSDEDASSIASED